MASRRRIAAGAVRRQVRSAATASQRRPVGCHGGSSYIRNFVTGVAVAIPLGYHPRAGGVFVVTMNARMQHRAHPMGAGHSIAVQNFNGNISILAMIATYRDDLVDFRSTP